jgi:hypothetical protein
MLFTDKLGSNQSQCDIVLIFLPGRNYFQVFGIFWFLYLRIGEWMETPADRYRAQAEECARRAKHAQDLNAQLEWQKLAASWHALAERSEKNRGVEGYGPLP